jgi:hypothetical protein
MNYKFILAIILISATANVTIGAGLGIPIEVDAKKSASESGYSHGEKDCNKYQNGNDNLYITGYNKEGESTGPAYHTDAFNEAYIEGWVDAGCSVNQFYNLDFSNDGNGYQNQNTRVTTNTAIDDSFNNRDSVVQPQSQSANTVQSAGCPSQIINGDCIIGQEQKTNNEFAQANRADN